MGVVRMGADRRRAVNAALLPRSPEFEARRAQPMDAPGVEPQTVVPASPPEPPLTVRITCPLHGQLVATPVDCLHELHAVAEEVRHAHFAGFGADCDSPLTIRHGGGDG